MSITTEISRIQNKIKDCYTECNNKGATMPVLADQNSDNLPPTIETITGGSGIDVVINNYKVANGNNISAGDFVSFVNSVYASIEQDIVSGYPSSSSFMFCTKLDEERVFCSFDYEYPTSASGTIGYCVVKVKDDDIEVGPTYTMGSTMVSYSGQYHDCRTISPNKVVLVTSRQPTSGSSSTTFDGIVFNISGLTVTSRTVTNSMRSLSANCYAYPHMTKLEDGKLAVVVHPDTYNRYIYILTVNSSDKCVLSSSYVASPIQAYNMNTNPLDSICALSPTKILYVCSSYTSTYQQHVVLINVSGTSLSVASYKQTDTTQNSCRYVDVIKVNENKALLTYSYLSNQYLHASIVTISGNSFTRSTDYTISNSANAGKFPRAALINQNLAILQSASNIHLLKINGTQLTIDGSFTHNYPQKTQICSLFNNTRAFVICAKTQSGQAHCMVVDWNAIVKKITSSSQLIAGVAKDSGVGGTDGLNWTNTSNGTYKFQQNGKMWTSTNKGVASSTATSTWTVTVTEAMSYKFSYFYSSEANCDKFYLTLDGTTIANGLSGLDTTVEYTANLSTGTHTLVARYTKDGSVDGNFDYCYVVLPDLTPGAEGDSIDIYEPKNNT